jgi:hypothetical protein
MAATAAMIPAGAANALDRALNIYSCIDSCIGSAPGRISGTGLADVF